MCRVRALFFLLVLGAAGCATRTAREERAVEQALDRARALLDQRHDREALLEAIDLLRSLARIRPGDPEILGALSLSLYALGYGYPSPETATLYAEGREVGWQCLLADPAFAGVLDSRGGAVTRVAARRIPEARADCLLGLVQSWSRWVALSGPAAMSLDLAPLEVLAEQAIELAPEGERFLPRLVHARVLALVPVVLEPDVAKARAAFDAACAAAPLYLTCPVDRAEYLLAPRGEAVELRDILHRVLEAHPEGTRFALENRRAQERARALLEAGANAGRTPLPEVPHPLEERP